MPALPKVLLVGYIGQVGTEMWQLLTAGGYDFVVIDREECDLTVPGAVRDVIRKVSPKVIVNAAAYTAVDRAETETAIASAINAEAPSEMARAAREVGALFVHYSTDYVFNGEHSVPWVETDTTGPINAYGRTKLDGEKGVLAANAASFIFRTSWVYGAHGANFLLTMLRLGASREELSVVHDQLGAPTWSRSLADVTLHTIRRFTRQDGVIDMDAALAKSGLYHATCGGVTTWFDFASAIFDDARKLGLPMKINEVKPIRGADYPSAAARPTYSVLSNEKLKRELGFSLPDWREALTEVMKQVAAQSTSSEAAKP
jgi:dTDP-4-dehydrorhamnose reductase